MWMYQQSTGELSHYGRLVTIGYSGAGEGRNNPALQAVVDVGPIPRGDYIIGPPECSIVPGPHGPYVLRLTRAPGTNTEGRDGFLIHGDAIEHPGAASHGCIVILRWARELIASSGDDRLRVVA